MPDQPWKAEERKVAKEFGTKRALMKGTGEKSDVEHPLFCVDVKLRKRWEVDRWFDELRAYAALPVKPRREILSKHPTVKDAKQLINEYHQNRSPEARLKSVNVGLVL